MKIVLNVASPYFQNLEEEVTLLPVLIILNVNLPEVLMVTYLKNQKSLGKIREQILIFFFLLVLMALTFNSVPKRKIQKLNLNA